jgi:hypothetical protein
MIRNPVSIFIAIALVSIFACSNQKKDAEPQGFLATHIFDDGSKQFVYTVDLSELSKGGEGGRGAGRPGNATGHASGGSNRGLYGGVSAGTSNSRSSGKADGRTQGRAAMLTNAIDNELKKSGFCRDGYKQLDRMMEPHQTFIKGECNEAASANDSKEFPNDTD